MKRGDRRNGLPGSMKGKPPRRTGARLAAWWNRLVGGYAGIVDPERHLTDTGVQGWQCVASCELPAVESFTQAQLEPDVPNCTLVSIVRCLLYLQHRGPASETERAALYEQVRRIGIRHGYAPDKTGWFHDLFVYSPFIIARMVTESAIEAGMQAVRGRSRYVRRLVALRGEIDAGRPVMLNLSFGDYPGHTVTVTGYRIYRSRHGAARVYLRTIDGWRDVPSYIDWHRARRMLSSVTCFSLTDYGFLQQKCRK